MPLPDDVAVKDYRDALAADIIGTARKLVTACRASGQRREDFELTIRNGNKAGSWTDPEGNLLPIPVLQLLRDCETRWSSTFLMLDRVVTLLPVSASRRCSQNVQLNVYRRRLKILPLSQNRQNPVCHHSCLIKRRYVLRSTSTKSSRFRISPKNFCPPIKHPRSHSPFPSTTRLLASGNQNKSNIPSCLHPSKWELRNSGSILPRPRSHRYTHLQLVCRVRHHVAFGLIGPSFKSMSQNGMDSQQLGWRSKC